jgi:hypothetical protein
MISTCGCARRLGVFDLEGVIVKDVEVAELESFKGSGGLEEKLEDGESVRID